MKHFTTNEWVDFIRDVASEDQKAVIERHLKTGCRDCRSEADFWRHVRETALRGANAVPADGTVRSVKAMLRLAPGKRAAKHALIPQLLFDSLRQPLPEGVRSSAPSPRQLLFGAGSLRIDLRMEPRMDSENVALIGQILDSANPGDSDGGSVVLLKAGTPVAEARTNSFGEFQLECHLAERLEMRVRLPLREEISLFLIDPVQPVEGRRDSTDSKEVSTGKKSRSTRKKVP
jgi:hypothetical protein